MTTLKETLKKDFLAAYKAGEKDKVAVLRAINGAITTEEKSGKQATEFNDEQVQALIAKEAKKRKATAEEYSNANQPERAEKEAWEAEFLTQYLPKQLSEDEIRGIVRNEITWVLMNSKPEDKTNVGLIMKSAMFHVKGKADGKLVKQIVDEELAAAGRG